MTSALSHAAVIFIVLCCIVNCYSSGPKILEYREMHYPSDAPCFSSVFFFKPSGQANSTFTLIKYKQKPFLEDRLCTKCCSISITRGQGICEPDQTRMELSTGVYRFQLIENTTDGRSLKSPEFKATFDYEKTRYKDLTYFHAVKMNGNSSDLVHLTWVEYISPKQCKSFYRLYYYYVGCDEADKCGQSEEISKDMIFCKKLTNVKGFERWSRCFTTISVPSNQEQEYYRVYYEIYDQHFTKRSRQVDLQQLIPATQCYINEKNQFVLTWEAVVNETNSLEVLNLSYTYYKLTIQLEGDRDKNNKTIKKIYLPLNTSKYTTDEQITSSDCHSNGAVTLYLDLCIRNDCTRQITGCHPCVGVPDPSQSNGINQEDNLEDWWYIMLVLVPLVAFLAVMIYKRKHVDIPNVFTTTTGDIITPRVPSINQEITGPPLPPLPPSRLQRPPLPPMNVKQHVYNQLRQYSQ